MPLYVKGQAPVFDDLKHRNISTYLVVDIVNVIS